MNSGQEDYIVQFVGVQKSYDGENLVVKDLNLNVERGEFLTMLGPSGSGKTTVLMMLAGFEVPTHGDILLNGQPINNVPPHKRGIGMVFQNYALFPHMTIAENLAFPLQVRRMGKADAEAKVKRALSMVRLDDFGNRRPAQLSGGQQQRVAIARALALEPKVLICDESVSMLDAEVQAEVLDLLRQLQHKLGLAMIFVTHDLSVASGFCHRVIVLDHGHIVEEGPGDRIFQAPQAAISRTLVDACPRLPR